MFQIAETLSNLKKLTEEYNLVSEKTNALHTMSEQLLADQTKLSSIGKDITCLMCYKCLQIYLKYSLYQKPNIYIKDFISVHLLR